MNFKKKIGNTSIEMREVNCLGCAGIAVTALLLLVATEYLLDHAYRLIFRTI
jgi:hypothetical protein